MKILVYTPVFYPRIGGMETVSEQICELITKSGHECILITPIHSSEKDTFSFQVYRNPNLITRIRLVRWADLVFTVGASMALLPLTKVFFKPFVWKHAGYQASCIDGLGWVDGKPAPVSPLKSINYHFRKNGLGYTLIGSIKLLLRRIAAKYIVDMNVAITDWMLKKQSFKKQVRIYNPFPLEKFSLVPESIREEYDFVYVGRLVSEKGLKTLLRALRILIKKFPEKSLKLLIIGDGDQRSELEKLAEDTGIKKHVTFAGSKRGKDLTDFIQLAPIAVVPSEWEEPMGIVALELMACGRNVIVSEKGGLKECVGEAGLTFPNGNAEALAQYMELFLFNKELRKEKKGLSQKQLEKFNPNSIAKQYIDLFSSLTKKV